MTRYYVKFTNLVRNAHNRAIADPQDQGGVAAEYGVLLAGIVALVAVAALALGGRISALFDTILP
jgi:Flp pilus assembly pilin Flp